MSFQSMITPTEADHLIASHLPSWPVEGVGLDHAHGRVLREAVKADRDQPPFDRVTMDGIALDASGLIGGRRDLSIQAVQAAGQPPLALRDTAACIQIMTGAVMPEGCDTIIPVEQIHVEGSVARLDDAADWEPGRFVHRQGSDYRSGDTLVPEGTLLRAPEIAVLASVGRDRVTVTRWPDVSVISTGDELVGPGDPVLPHQVRSCNDQAIAAALSARGLNSIQCHRLPDDREVLRACLSTALSTTQLLVLSGGVSMGQFDYLPGLFEELGVQRVFHRIRQRPGKPLWFGVSTDGVPVFGLPGNPVSALVCLHRYVLPAIDRAAGRQPVVARSAPIDPPPVTSDWHQFLPVLLDSAGVARPVKLNTSGDFFSLSGTDGLAEWPAGGLPEGQGARLLSWWPS